MKPVLTTRPLTDFNSKRQEELCRCDRRCQNVVLMVQDEFVYQVCEKGAVEFASSILTKVGRVGDPSRLVKNQWTSLEIQQLKDYVNAFGGKIPKGAYSKFAKMIGKDRRQIRDKVQVLRARGELPPAVKD